MDPSSTSASQRARALLLAAAALVLAVVGVVLILAAPALADGACRDWGVEQGYTKVEFSAGKKTDNCQGVDADGEIRYTTAQAPAWLTVAAIAAFGGAIASFVAAAMKGALRAVVPPGLPGR